MAISLITHLGCVMHIIISKLWLIGFKYWAFACSMPSHDLKDICILATAPLRNSGKIWIKIWSILLQKHIYKMTFAKWWPFSRSFRNRNQNFWLLISAKDKSQIFSWILQHSPQAFENVQCVYGLRSYNDVSYILTYIRYHSDNI